MQAYYSTELLISGTEEELIKAIITLQSFSEGDVWLVNACICKKNEQIHMDALHTSDDILEAIKDIKLPIKITADGPWGSYGELSEVDLFKELADAIPFSSFSCHVSGQTTYYDEHMDCELKDQKLFITTLMEENECIYENYREEVRNKLPYWDFVKLLKINEDDFDEDRYDEYLEEAQYRSRFLYDEYEEFIDDCYESEVTADEYLELQKVIEELGINFDSYSETHDAGRMEQEIYDPIEHLKAKEKANEIISRQQTMEDAIDDCFSGYFKDNTIILTVDNVEIDETVSAEMLVNAGLIDRADLTAIEEESGYYELIINKPVFIWNEKWIVTVYFEDYSEYGYDGFAYCATYISLANPVDDKTDFQLMKKHAQAAFGKSHKIDKTDYIFINQRGVYLRQRAAGWRIEVFSASGD